MKDYQERVVKERDELSQKLVRLNDFLRDKAGELISREENARMMAQRAAMSLYVYILNERIKNFKP